MRKKAGLSQENMALELHMSISNISRLETNKYELKAMDLIRWCQITNAQEMLIAFMLGADGLTKAQQIVEVVVNSGILGTIGILTKLFW